MYLHRFPQLLEAFGTKEVEFGGSIMKNAQGRSALCSFHQQASHVVVGVREPVAVAGSGFPCCVHVVRGIYAIYQVIPS